MEGKENRDAVMSSAGGGIGLWARLEYDASLDVGLGYLPDMMGSGMIVAGSTYENRTRRKA
jgi:hypothetical protein